LLLNIISKTQFLDFLKISSRKNLKKHGKIFRNAWLPKRLTTSLHSAFSAIFFLVHGIRLKLSDFEVLKNE